MLNGIEEPIITVQVDVEMCAHEVRFNDVPLVRDAEGLPMTAEIPVNHWTVSGQNTLAMRLSPNPGEGGLDPAASCELTVYLRQNRAERGERREVFRLKGPEPEAAGIETRGEIQLGEVKSAPDPDGVSVTIRRTLTMSAGFPDWSWPSAEPLQESDEVRSALLAEYEKVWSALRDGDWELPVALSSTKIEELSAAFHVSREEMEDELEYESLVGSDDVELWPWKPDDLSLEVFGFGRLARLARHDGESPIVFVCRDRSAAHYLDLVFCRQPDGWHLVR